MEAQIKLGRILGVEIGLQYSWIIIAFLITLSLAGHFQTENPEWGSGVVWVSAILTAALFFAAIVAHELSHAAVAKARGLPVRSITLFALGGVANIEKEAGDAKTEFWMGIAGPIASVLIGMFLLGIASVLGWVPEPGMTLSTPETPLLAMLVWLGYINISLAVFNMIPGFPLDGGRVLRAILWWLSGDADRATRSAARAGQFVAFFFIQSKEQCSTIACQRDSRIGMPRKSAIPRIWPSMSRLRFVKCTNFTLGSSRICHQLRTFSQNGQNGWPSRSIQSRQYRRMSFGGGSIGGPTRPGVSFNASYHD